MTTAEKIIALHDLTGLSAAQFSNMVNIAPSTMSRIRSAPDRHIVSPDTAQNIANAFEEIDLKWLTDPTVATLPATLTPKSGQIARNEDTEGSRLGQYLRKHGIKKIELARELGVSHVQVSNYVNATNRFHQSTLESIVSALSSLRKTQVKASDILGVDGMKQTPALSIVAVPRLPLSSRTDLAPKKLATLQASFMPAIRPDSALYIPKSYVPESLIGHAYALEIGPADHMGDVRPGYWVLALEIPADAWNGQHDAWNGLHDGNVAILTTSGQLLLKRIVRNTLRVSNSIELTSPERGGSVTLHRDDIVLLFHLTRILDGAL